MKIQFASDLHLEFTENSHYLKHHPLEVAGDVLLLAGDTVYLGVEPLMKHPFWKWAADNFEKFSRFQVIMNIMPFMISQHNQIRFK